MEDRIWLLFARRVSGEITAEEDEEFEGLVGQLSAGSEDIRLILAILDARSSANRVATQLAEDLWPRLEAAIKKLHPYQMKVKDH